MNRYLLTFLVAFFLYNLANAQELDNYAPEKISSSYNSRLALVIGNSNYQDRPLKNPANDAKAITRELEKAGFDVISYTDLNRSGMRSAIREFGQKVQDSKGVGLFYYAGHGLQSRGVNYLVPTDADIQVEYEIEDMCIRADQVLRMMELYQNPLNIVIIDACRNNPYRSLSRDMGEGLAMPDNAPVGTIVAFATAPGKTASDGDGDNGLYTQELIKAMQIPGLPIEQIFKQVRINVLQLSNRRQSPWENSSLTGDFYFYPPTTRAKKAIVERGIDNKYYEFEGLNFFEAGLDVNNKVFNKTFDRSQVRYIYAQVDFKNKKYGEEDWITNFKFKYYKPNGLVWTDLSPNTVVESTWEDAYAHSGWGWSNPGYWGGGRYKVEVWDGDQLVGEDYFSVTGNNRDNYSLTALEFGEEVAAGEVVVKDEFDIYESRYVKTQLTFDNQLYGQKEWLSSFVAKYYEPDGKYFGEVTISKSVPPDLKTVTTNSGYGYPNIGYWKEGDYKVEIWDGDDKVAERTFKMLDNRASYAGNYKLQTIGFYEADGKGELADLETSFPQSSRYIWTKIQFVNFLFEKEPWETNFEVKYFKPDGTQWADFSAIWEVPTDLEYVFVRNGWGWNTPGYWEPGTYRVEVYDAGELIGDTSFEIEEPKTNYIFQGIKFFEAGEDYDSKEYNAEFDQSVARYLYTELDLKNLKEEQIEWVCDFKVKYYYPDGAFFGEFSIKNTIPANLGLFNVRNGYGYQEAGKWELGTYKVEVFDGEELIGTSSFTIK